MSKAKRKEKRAERKEKRAEKKASGTRFIDKVGKKIKAAAETLGDVKFAPLLPFRNKMNEMLKAKGQETHKDLSDLAKNFTKYIILGGKDNFEIDHTKGYKERFKDEHFIEDVVAVVKKIVKFFKDSKSKKDSGEKLTGDELAAANGLEQVEKDLKAAEESEATATAGTSDIMKYSLIAIALFIGLKVMKVF